MTDLKQFKNIADSTLNNLTVSEELKMKTLNNLYKNKTLFPGKFIIPTACAAALTIAVSAGVFFSGSNQAPKAGTTGTGISTMSASDNKGGANPQDSTFSPGAQVLESWNVESMEDVKKHLGGAALIPSYIPENSTLKEIIAAGPTAGNAISVMMEFELLGRPFTITQDKGVTKKINPENSRQIEINGSKGFVQSTSFDNGGTKIYSTTVRWYKDDLMYAVQGSISEDEAMKVAQSLE